MGFRSTCALSLVLSLSFALAGCDDAQPDEQLADSMSVLPDVTDTGDDGDVDANVDGQTVDATVRPDARFVELVRCESDEACDDGVWCTDDACVDSPGEGRVCRWTVQANRCLINKVCRVGGAPSLNNGCQVCDPTVDVFAWTTAADGAGCEDGDLCTEGDTCSAGQCGGGTEVTCDDGNVCTIDSCDPAVGCRVEPVSDTDLLACDDGQSCTTDDVCVDGECAGTAPECDDGNPCTDDACTEDGGCTHTFNTAPCDDGDACTLDTVCSEGVCGGGIDNTCDDGNQCTIDVCNSIGGCTHLPTQNPCCIGAASVCDDGNPCTDDICDPDTVECSYAFNTDTCDDGNICTESDVCIDGACGGDPRDCDDANDCTDDSCNIGVGCVNTALATGTCDDGLACSTGDTCVAGVCTADTSMCLCIPQPFADAAKIVTVAVGADAMAGNALDVNGDGSLDNSLAPLGGIVNGDLQGAVDDGSLILLFEFEGLMPGMFALNLVPGELDPGNPACDIQTATCDYLAARSGIDPNTCEPETALPATLTATDVAAGGPGTTLPFSIPLGSGAPLDITLYNVTVDLDVTLVNDEVAEFAGVIGGAALETELEAAILALDPASLPADPATILSLLDSLAPNDIDVNGDGTDDAKSIGLVVTGIDGVITGIANP